MFKAENIGCSWHYSGVIMNAMASQITGVSSVCSAVFLAQINKTSCASLAFVRGIYRVTDGFPSQRASNAEHGSIWRRHHGGASCQASIHVCAKLSYKMSTRYSLYLNPEIYRVVQKSELFPMWSQDQMDRFSDHPVYNHECLMYWHAFLIPLNNLSIFISKSAHQSMINDYHWITTHSHHMRSHKPLGHGHTHTLTHCIGFVKIWQVRLGLPLFFFVLEIHHSFTHI